MPQLYKLYPITMDADVQPIGSWFSKYARILPITGPGSFSETLTSNQIIQGFVFCYPGEIDIRAGSETYIGAGAGPVVARINVTTANSNVNWRIRSHRIDKYGYIRESTPWTAYRALSTTGLHNRATSNLDWSYQAAPDDRLAVEYSFTTAAASASFAFQLDQTTPLDVPFPMTKFKYYDTADAQWKTIQNINYWEDGEWKKSGAAYHWDGSSWVRFYLRNINKD